MLFSINQPTTNLDSTKSCEKLESHELKQIDYWVLYFYQISDVIFYFFMYRELVPTVNLSKKLKKI